MPAAFGPKRHKHRAGKNFQTKEREAHKAQTAAKTYQNKLDWAREVRDMVFASMRPGQRVQEYWDPDLYDEKSDELCSRALVKLLHHGK